MILLVCCIWLGSGHVVYIEVYSEGLGAGVSEISERSLQFGRLTSTGSWTTVSSMICRTGFLDVWYSNGHGDVSVIKGFSSQVL